MHFARRRSSRTDPAGVLSEINMGELASVVYALFLVSVMETRKQTLCVLFLPGLYTCLFWYFETRACCEFQTSFKLMP